MGKKMKNRNEELRERRAAGERVADLAEEFGLSEGRIYQLTGPTYQGHQPEEAPEELSPPTGGTNVEDPPAFTALEGLADQLEDLLDSNRRLVDLYESEGFYENRLISTVKNYRFSRVGGSGSGVVMLIQVPSVKKAREAAAKGFLRFLPED